MKIVFNLIIILFFPLLLIAQQEKEKENLGDKEYIVVKDYKPVLGESLKISETPEGDTSSTTPPAMDYDLRAKKMNSDYEASSIKAVKIKDEQLAKLYRTYLKLGLGNYTAYQGDLFINALRSKSGALGLALNHLSADPGLDDVGPAAFSHNHGGVYGKYFFDHNTFTGEFNYNRDVSHYYGYNTNDTIIDKNDLKQIFNKFGLLLDYGSNYLTRDHIDYDVAFGYSTLNDHYDVTENDFLISGKAGKKFYDYYLNADVSFNYFNKSLAKGEEISLLNNLNRSIVTFVPSLTFKREKISLVLGLNLGIEKNLDSDVHLFPKIDISLPVAEHILYLFGGVNGNIVKNTYQTIVTENPFVTSEIQPRNTINKLELKAGLNGNFSTVVSFMGMVKYSTIDSMMLFYNDVKYFNKFNAVYENGKVLNLHGELSIHPGNKFITTIRFDQYKYTMDNAEYAWHKPNTEMVLIIKYNFYDKLILNASVYARGKYYVRLQDSLGYVSQKVDGYTDENLGLEYRYSKILSFYINFNNLGFAREYEWYNYPSERFNVMGGITFSF